MPVFDFNHTPEAEKDPECTYTVFYSNKHEASLEDPILLLDNRKGLLQHHSSGSLPIRFVVPPLSGRKKKNKKR